MGLTAPAELLRGLQVKFNYFRCGNCLLNCQRESRKTFSPLAANYYQHACTVRQKRTPRRAVYSWNWRKQLGYINQSQEILVCSCVAVIPLRWHFVHQKTKQRTDATHRFTFTLLLVHFVFSHSPFAIQRTYTPICRSMYSQIRKNTSGHRCKHNVFFKKQRETETNTQFTEKPIDGSPSAPLAFLLFLRGCSKFVCRLFCHAIPAGFITSRWWMRKRGEFPCSTNGTRAPDDGPSGRAVASVCRCTACRTLLRSASSATVKQEKNKIRVKSIYRLIRRVIGRACGQWAPSFGRQSKFMFQDTSNAWPDFKANCTENIDVWKPISGSFMTHPPPSVALEKKCNEIRRNVIWVLERCFTFLLKWSKGVEQTHSRMLRKLRQSRATESISRRNWPDVSGGSAATRTPLLSSKTESFISVGMAASGWSDTTNRTAFFSRWLSSSSASTSRLSGGDWGFSSSSACAQSFS